MCLYHNIYHTGSIYPCLLPLTMYVSQQQELYLIHLWIHKWHMKKKCVCCSNIIKKIPLLIVRLTGMTLMVSSGSKFLCWRLHMYILHKNEVCLNSYLLNELVSIVRRSPLESVREGEKTTGRSFTLLCSKFLKSIICTHFFQFVWSHSLLH